MTTKKYNCPVEVTLDVIGGKWKTVILYHLSDHTLRYSQLQRMIPTITQRMLTLQLRELEADGVIRKIEEQGLPRRVEYSLTDYGRTITPILEMMCKWGNKRIDQYNLQLNAITLTES